MFLTAAHARQTPGADVLNGVSIDQLYAQRSGRIRASLHSTLHRKHRVGDTCGYNYNCIYSETIKLGFANGPFGDDGESPRGV